jgi:hypothetical protein
LLLIFLKLILTIKLRMSSHFFISKHMIKLYLILNNFIKQKQ